MNGAEKDLLSTPSAQTQSHSTEKQYQDYSGVNTESFIIQTLRNHPKDRAFLFNLEKFFREFIQDDQQTTYRFQSMNSYERMLVHRVAAFFGLHHRTEKSGQCVIISKTATMRLPDFSFQTVIDDASNETGEMTSTPMNLESRPNGKSLATEQRKKPVRTLPASNQAIPPPIAPIHRFPMGNYIPLVPTTNGSPFYSAHGIPLTPIFLHPSPTGPIPYLYPTVSPIYRSVPLQYPTNQFAALTLQSPVYPSTINPPRHYLGRSLVQSSAMTRTSRPKSD